MKKRCHLILRHLTSLLALKNWPDVVTFYRAWKRRELCHCLMMLLTPVNWSAKEGFQCLQNEKRQLHNTKLVAHSCLLAVFHTPKSRTYWRAKKCVFFSVPRKHSSKWGNLLNIFWASFLYVMISHRNVIVIISLHSFFLPRWWWSGQKGDCILERYDHDIDIFSYLQLIVFSVSMWISR